MGNFLNRLTMAGCALGLTVFASLSLLSTTTLATTPDGQTPANEGKCDMLQGGTGGLYGLCVAYCEAQDLDTVDKEPPRLKILENYRKKMQPGDPDMPCVNVSCPCWSDEEFASINGAACSVSTSTILIIGAAAETHQAFADTNRNRCSYVDENVEPDNINTQNAEPDQAVACFAQIQAACDLI